MIKNVRDSAIEVHDLTVSYDKKPVLWDVDFTLPRGQMVGIVGPNGSGKTTLLKTIMGLMKSDSGHVRIYNQELKEVRRKVSYVPQRESVDWDFPASVLDVVLMGTYGQGSLLKRISRRDREIALDALEKVSMASYRSRQISKLSGGQQQRVFLARSLAQQADLYLMDEPFVGIDAASENAIIDLLNQMKDQGKTIVVVHHDLQSVMDYFDWTVLLNTRLIASGPTNEVFTNELLQETYGGKLTLLTKIGDLLRQKEIPVREKPRK